MTEIQIIGPNAPIPRPMEHRRDIVLPRGTFSFSQFRLEKSCAACYEARYVFGRPTVIKPALVTGSAIHSALSTGRRALRAKQSVGIDLVKDAAAQGFDDALKGLRRDGEPPVQEPVYELGRETSWGAVKDKAVKTAQFTVMEVLKAESKHKVVAVEAEVAMHGVFPFSFAAYIDRMLDDESWDVFGHIGDDKSVGKDEAPDVWTAWQCTTYSLPFWLAGEQVEVGVNQHGKTATPFVHLWSEPGYSFRPTKDEHLAVYNMIVRSAERISRGIFEPGPHPWGCDYEHPKYPRFGVVVPKVAVA